MKMLKRTRTCMGFDAQSPAVANCSRHRERGLPRVEEGEGRTAPGCHQEASSSHGMALDSTCMTTEDGRNKEIWKDPQGTREEAGNPRAGA